MPDPKQQATTQLANIESATGKTVADFAKLVTRAGLEKHGQMVTFLKNDHGLTHGNANLIAHSVRDHLAGGALDPEALLEAQYSGAKAALRPIYEALAEIALSSGGDVEMVVQKTGVSFRRSKQFALVQAPSSKRVQLGLNLDATPDDDRVTPTTGMCTHRVNMTNTSEVDDAVAGWIRTAYDNAG